MSKLRYVIEVVEETDDLTHITDDEVLKIKEELNKRLHAYFKAMGFRMVIPVNVQLEIME